MFPQSSLVCVIAVASVASAVNIVLTNDDGWATANMRAQNTALKAAGYDVTFFLAQPENLLTFFEVLVSAPAENKSGSASLTTTPVPRTSACQFSTCPSGSPAQGVDPNDDHIYYVNAYPVDAVAYGIKTLAPKLFGAAPDFVVSGSNIGSNLGIWVGFSGTIGAAAEAAIEGIPSVAFSGSSGSSVSYTTLTSSPNSAASIAAKIYAAHTTEFVNALIASGKPYLPAGISLNVNYPSSSACPTVRFVLTRIASSSTADVATCGTTKLPTESSVVGGSGCFASVSVFDAKTKKDSSVANQAVVLKKLSSLLVCK